MLHVLKVIVFGTKREKNQYFLFKCLNKSIKIYFKDITAHLKWRLSKLLSSTFSPFFLFLFSSLPFKNSGEFTTFTSKPNILQIILNFSFSPNVLLLSFFCRLHHLPATSFIYQSLIEGLPYIKQGIGNRGKHFNSITAKNIKIDNAAQLDL